MYTHLFCCGVPNQCWLSHTPRLCQAEIQHPNNSIEPFFLSQSYILFICNPKHDYRKHQASIKIGHEYGYFSALMKFLSLITGWQHSSSSFFLPLPRYGLGHWQPKEVCAAFLCEFQNPISPLNFLCSSFKCTCKRDVNHRTSLGLFCCYIWSQLGGKKVYSIASFLQGSTMSHVRDWAGSARADAVN